jgi:alpha-glucosidase
MQAHPLSREINVASQLKDSNSVLSFWKKALHFRKEFSDLTVYGDYKLLRREDPDVYAFVKESQVDGSKVAVVLNFTAEEKTFSALSGEELEVSNAKLVPVMSTHAGKEQTGVLSPFEGRVYLVT